MMVTEHEISGRGVEYCLSIEHDTTGLPLKRHLLKERLASGYRADCNQLCEALAPPEVRGGDDLPAWEDCTTCFPTVVTPTGEASTFATRLSKLFADRDADQPQPPTPGR